MMMDTCVVSLFSCVVYASLRNFRINTQLLIIAGVSFIMHRKKEREGGGGEVSKEDQIYS